MLLTHLTCLQIVSNCRQLVGTAEDDRNILADEFLNADVMETENGLLVQDLVARVYRYYDDVPDEYMRFLVDIGKQSSVPGLLQVTGPHALQLLQVIVYEESLREAASGLGSCPFFDDLWPMCKIYSIIV